MKDNLPQTLSDGYIKVSAAEKFVHANVGNKLLDFLEQVVDEVDGSIMPATSDIYVVAMNRP